MTDKIIDKANNQATEVPHNDKEYKGVDKCSMIVDGKRFSVYTGELFMSVFNADNRCIGGFTGGFQASCRLKLKFMPPCFPFYPRSFFQG